MNISTTTSSVQTSNSTQSNVSSSKTIGKSDRDSSFETEMKKTSGNNDVEKNENAQVEENTEQEISDNVKEKSDVNDKPNSTNENNQNAQMENEAQNALLEAEMNTMLLMTQNQFDTNNLALKNASRDLENMTMLTNYSLKVDYTTVQMDMDDAQFFTDLVQNPDMTLQNVVSELQQSTNSVMRQGIQKNVQVSSVLMNALSEAVKSNQPFRIDFDKDISVIIKVDKEGVMSARFIPGDSAVEQYLKQNIQGLKQRFDEKEISYNELSYTNQQQKRQQRNNKGDK